MNCVLYYKTQFINVHLLLEKRITLKQEVLWPIPDREDNYGQVLLIDC